MRGGLHVCGFPGLFVEVPTKKGDEKETGTEEAQGYVIEDDPACGE